jgi:hypothetical protein
LHPESGGTLSVRINGEDNLCGAREVLSASREAEQGAPK